VALQAPANAALRLGNEIDQFLEDRWLLCLEADLLQGPRLRSLDLAPVSPAAGRGFLLAQRLRQASTKLGAVSSLVLWRLVGCSLIRSTHLRLIATVPRSSLVRILKQRFGAVAPAVKLVHRIC
jgi:hypothetical protein